MEHKLDQKLDMDVIVKTMKQFLVSNMTIRTKQLSSLRTMRISELRSEMSPLD